MTRQFSGPVTDVEGDEHICQPNAYPGRLHFVEATHLPFFAPSPSPLAARVARPIHL